eukprot:gnl/TRDRNA2_/TRDRNA2_218145_c0_seq1.p1 gnl/TRDRNA2_/TRDRNA2_218145_c0~~gnl/TRDRNA2_/TRDRNA2_218145_c0_seq1.p1  ORF type:complete len:141 (+),score=21.18 gnl/TRDRNA2_/TRDRNA2_218145_c0_seq1:2-424(+)
MNTYNRQLQEYKQRLLDYKMKQMLVRFGQGIAKFLLENSCQLWLQASFFAITFPKTTAHAKVKLLISMGLGIVSLLVKFLELVYDGAVAGAKGLFFYAALAPALLSVFTGMWTAAKLYHAYTCESHMWNLFDGCVQLSAS